MKGIVLNPPFFLILLFFASSSAMAASTVSIAGALMCSDWSVLASSLSHFRKEDQTEVAVRVRMTRLYRLIQMKSSNIDR
uniref:Uncharacterized protein n=1 Tax=Oryza glumipatula TaxID=40148 RepID=A0A0E0A7W3_9ORYZ